MPIQHDSISIPRRRVLAVAAACASMAIPSVYAQSGRAALRLRYGHSQPVGHSTDVAARQFIDIVQKETAGAVAIDLFPNGQLGSDRELQTMLETGQLDFVHSNSATLGAFLPQIGVMDLPFVWRNAEHYLKVVGGPFANSINELLAAKTGHHYLAWWFDGFRHVYTRNKPINALADMRGLKIRAPESKVFIDTFKALGANPTPLAFPEIYTALDAGVIDGFEGSNGVVYSSKIYEVAKNRAVIGHIMVGFGLTTQIRKFDTWPADVRQVVQKAALTVQTEQRRLQLGAEEDLRKKLLAAGVRETTPDLAPFRQAVHGVHVEFHKRYGTEKLRDAIESAA